MLWSVLIGLGRGVLEECGEEGVAVFSDFCERRV